MIGASTILSTLLLSTTVNSFSVIPSTSTPTKASWNHRHSSSRSSSTSASSPTTTSICAKPGEFDYALIFDCDGVIIETEELHRLAYNAAFKAANLEIDGEPVE